MPVRELSERRFQSVNLAEDYWDKTIDAYVNWQEHGESLATMLLVGKMIERYNEMLGNINSW